MTAATDKVLRLLALDVVMDFDFQAGPDAGPLRRYDQALVEQLLQGVRDMEESVTYQAIVEKGVVKGRLQGARHILALLGEEQFGAPPGRRDRARIEAVSSLEQLEQLTRRMRHVGSWDELLAEAPPPEPRRGGRKRG